jgi:hypothetical protein
MNPGQRPPSGQRQPSGQPPTSGLRNPAAAARGVGAAALAVEAAVLLLAIAPLHVRGAGPSGVTAGLLGASALVCVVFAGLLRQQWVWQAAWLPPAAMVAGGLLLDPVLAVLGVVFGLLWMYVLHVRRAVAR